MSSFPGMNRILFFLVCFLVANIVNFSTANDFNSHTSDFHNSGNSGLSIEKAPAAISATISGTTSTCLNTTNPVITFTGTGGTSPYKFTYKINNGADLTVSSVAGSDGATVSALTVSSGVYTYTLVKVEDANAGIQTLSEVATVTVNDLPVSEFSFPDYQCSGTDVQFTPTLSGNYTYTWNFGDGGTSSDPNPKHTFTSLGCGNFSYQVTLTVIDINGCQSSTAKTLNIKQTPDIDFVDVNNSFDPFSNCSNASASTPDYTITVGNNSASKSCITSYSIVWGDGNTASSVIFPVSHTYSELGAFNMVITAVSNGCSNSKQYTVKNVTNPSGGIVSPGTTTDLCAPTAPLQFEIAKWGANSPGTVYLVDYGDNAPAVRLTQEQLVASPYYQASDPSKSANYPIPHSYTTSNCPKSEFVATLTVTSACRSTNFTANSITILTKPEADFSVPVSGCINSGVLVTNTTVPGNSQNCNKKATYTWDFGDGTPLEVIPLSLPQNNTHTYANQGIYTIKLTAENFCGSTSKTGQIKINSLPTATISGITTICQNDPSPDITFTGANGNAPYTFTYTLNGGINKTVTTTSGSSATVSAVTTNSGTFTYSLVSVQEGSPSACSQAVTGTAIVNVIPLPTATISGSTGVCLNSPSPLITFTGAKGTRPYTFTYNINGGPSQQKSTITGDTVSIEAPTTSASTIIYNLVSVQDAGANTCSQLQGGSATITVIPTPTVNDVNLQTKCTGDMSDVVLFTGSVPGTVYNWTNTNPSIGIASIGTGNINPFLLKNTGTTVQTATFEVTPTYTSAGSTCTGTATSFTITVNPTPTITTQPKPGEVCLGGTADPLTIVFNGVGTPAYQWYRNTVNNNLNGTAIPDSINAIYYPSTISTDTTYYYCVISFTGGACSNLVSNTARIIVNPVPSIKTQPQAIQTICTGGTVPVSLKVDYTGGAGIGSCQWYSSLSNSTSGGTIIPNATGLTYTPPVFPTVGTYYYYAEIKFSGSGCNTITSDTARINVLTLPVISSQPVITQSLCRNTTPADLTVTASGGIGTFNFKWYSNTSKSYAGGQLIQTATTNTFTPPTSSVGTTWYYCVISQPNGAGCTAISDFSEVIVNATPTFTKQPVSGSVCIGSAPATLSVQTINGTGTPQHQWYWNNTNSVSGATAVPTATGSTFTPPSGTLGTLYYYCVVTFPTGGCSTITSNIAQITVNDYPVISDLTIELNSGQGFVITPNTTGDIIPAGTTYNWTLPQITPANSITGATAQPAGGNVFSQALDNTSNGIATATYTVTPVSNGCAGNPFQVVVTLNPPIHPDTTLINSTCFGAGNGSISTNISGGVPYKKGNPYLVAWTGPNGFNSTATTISDLKPGNYILDITDSVGYKFSNTYTVFEPEDLIIKSVPANVSCNGAANGRILLNVSGGTKPYSYAWKKDDVVFTGTNDIQNLIPGKYTVVVTDANNCVPKMDTIVITEPSAIMITLNKLTNINCNGDKTGAVTVDITGGIPFEKTPGVFSYTYLWTGPNGYSASTKDLSALAAGTYQLTVTDKTGCSKNFTATVAQPDPVVIKTTVTPVSCYGKKDASIQLDITGGMPPYKIVWNNLANGTVLTNLAPGTYSVQVTDSFNCQKSASATIAEANFSIKPVVKQITCFGANDGSVVLNIQGGVTPVTVKWSDDPAAGISRNGLKPGTYTVTVHDQASCDIVYPFTIIEPTELNFSSVTTDALVCNNQNSGAISLTPTGGVPPYKYLWSNGKTTKDLSAIPAGQYVVVITDANGCTATGKFDILRPAPIKLSVITTPDFNCMTLVSKAICTARITGGSAPYTFNWSGGTVSGTSNETMETALPGIYVLGVTDGNGCTAKLSFNVVLDYPGIDYQVTNCDKHALNFNAIIPYGVGSDFTYSWDFGDSKTDTKQNPEHIYALPGDYKVILTLTSPACTSTFTKVITVEAPPVLVLDKLPVFCTGDSILLHVSGADTYRWSDGSTGNSMWLKRTGDYFVTGTAKSGCTAQLPFTGSNFESFNYTIQSDHNDVTVKAPTLRLWSETISYSDYFWDFGDSRTAKGNIQEHSYNITQDGYYDIKLKVVNPNGCLEYATKRIWITDALKVNVLTPNGDGTNDLFLRGFHIQVYNRNGFLLYDGIDGWDGKYEGKLVSSDTYFYVIYLEGQSGVKTQTGFVTVIL